VALIAGQVQATVRLAKNGVFCINPTRIAIAGKIRVYCFDKTGTLTTDSLEFLGARPVVGGQLGDLAHPTESKAGSLDTDMMRALASCHAVAKFGDTFVGNQVEVKMFTSTGWDLIESAGSVELVAQDKSDRLHVLRRFEFDHTKQTMSVVVRGSKGKLLVYTKGSFEKVADAANHTTIPDAFMSAARGMALDGCYVLGLATKTLDSALSDEDIAQLEREGVEEGLSLLGLIAFRNELKPDTTQAINALKHGDVRPVMITGDNAQCGHYIAYKSGMAKPGSRMLLAEQDPQGTVLWNGTTLEDQSTFEPILTSALLTPEYVKQMESGDLELAITGKAYDTLRASGDLARLLLFVRVFARVNPANKIDVVEQFVERGLITGMCGDGGNDCGALRAAHAGMALSDAEASVVSPFTSKAKSCMSVVDLLREGKAALHTNLSSYKFLIMYGQLFSVWKLFSFARGVLPAMMCYLMVDVIAVVGLTYALTCAHPKEKLQPERPTASLFSPTTLSSVLGNLIVNLSFYFAIQFWIPSLPGYLKWPADLSSGSYWWVNGDNWESTGIYWPIYFQFITSAYIFGFGAQYKKAVLFNWQLTIIYAGLFFIGSYALLAEPNTLSESFHVASQQFNYLGVIPENPQSVWTTYQDVWGHDNPGVALCDPDAENSPPCSPAMSFSQRLTLYLIILGSLAAGAIWQSVFVDNVLKKMKHTDKNRIRFNL